MGKQNLYEHSVRIPLVFRGPGVPQGKMVYALASNIDIFPTVAGLCEVDLPEETEGISLHPIFSGESVGERGIVGSVYRDLQRMVTDGRWSMEVDPILSFTTYQHRDGTNPVVQSTR